MPPLQICLAEDDPGLRFTLRQMLIALGHSVVFAAENGEQLLAFAADHEFDLVLLDLDMPVMDGLTTAEHLKGRPAPIILLSGHSDLRHVVTDKEPIAISLAKPITLEVLQAAIESVVGERK